MVVAAAVMSAARPRRAGASRAGRSAGLAAALAVAVVAWSWRPASHGGRQLSQEASAVAFAQGLAPRGLPMVERGIAEEGSLVAMRSGSRRNKKRKEPKKLHIRNTDRDKVDRQRRSTPMFLRRFDFKREVNLERFAQTLKLSFPEGEDDVVTEEEVMEYFTTDEFKPDGAIVGHLTPLKRGKDEAGNRTDVPNTMKNTYVHFPNNEMCRKARKEKDGGPIGKASEVKVVFCDEKKWIRLKDGVRLVGWARAGWMKPYGWSRYEGYDSFEKLPDYGTRTSPYYPY